MGTTRVPTAANRLGLDYRAEAKRLGPPVCPIIDAHLHVNGPKAAAILREVMDLYGVERVYSQTQLAHAEAIKGVLGDRIRFVAIPEYMAADRAHAFRGGFLDGLERWYELGARMVKFWTAPRFVDIGADMGGLDGIWPADASWRVRVAEKAVELGMMLMIHVADPDTWFATKYADASRYGSKQDQWDAMDRFLSRFDVPCLGTHMGGWPEDLSRLDDILAKHPKLVLDTSATKWMVREISTHKRDKLVAFLDRWRGRILFGSDIVTHDEHLTPTDPDHPAYGNQLANSEGEAFELYASRYWAQRVMWETDYEGESNIADPDLMLVDPDHHDAMSAPMLIGRSLDHDRLRVLYRGAAVGSLDAWYERGAWEAPTAG